MEYDGLLFKKFLNFIKNKLRKRIFKKILFNYSKINHF